MAAAAAANAANLPNVRNIEVGSDEFPEEILIKEKQNLMKRKKEELSEKELSQYMFPINTIDWSVDDVCRWLKKISLGEYEETFRGNKKNKMKNHV